MFLIIFLFPALYRYFYVCQNQLFKRLTCVVFYLLKPVCSQELLAVLLIHSWELSLPSTSVLSSILPGTVWVPGGLCKHVL
ncbi:hypothetical protein ACRRTK_020485 [Alexandromys fortis]